MIAFPIILEFYVGISKKAQGFGSALKFWAAICNFENAFLCTSQITFIFFHHSVAGLTMRRGKILRKYAEQLPTRIWGDLLKRLSIKRPNASNLTCLRYSLPLQWRTVLCAAISRSPIQDDTQHDIGLSTADLNEEIAPCKCTKLKASLTTEIESKGMEIVIERAVFFSYM